MTTNYSRRSFLGRATAIGALSAATPWALNLAAMTEAAAQENPSDYKALVCIFLLGGNDHYNTIVPFDTDSYASYSRVRQGIGSVDDGNSTIAIARANLVATELKPTNPFPSGRSFALNPNLSPLHSLFNSGKLATILNVGSLEGPTTLADFRSGIGLPAKLFSHNDQTITWHRGSLGTATGYGGRLLKSMALDSSANDIYSSISLGTSSFLANADGAGYRLGTTGATALSKFFKNNDVDEAIRKIMRGGGANLLEQTHANMAIKALDAVDVVNPAFNAASVSSFPATALGDQLKAIAKLIAARTTLKQKRQVFYAAIGGFDTHAGMPTNHDALMTQVGDAMSAFYSATVSLGVSDQVTTFTGSDFGRTLSSNGDGSDHGWGSFHFVMGGAVEGKRWYGQAPVIAVNGPDDVGSGRLLPAVSVDQYMATLATWFGVSATNLPDLIPRIKRYDTADLGFMKTI